MISDESLNDLEDAARDQIAGKVRKSPLMNAQDVLAFVAEVRRLRERDRRVHDLIGNLCLADNTRQPLGEHVLALALWANAA